MEKKPTYQETLRLATEAQVSYNTAAKWFREGGAHMNPSVKIRIVGALKRISTTRGKGHRGPSRRGPTLAGSFFKSSVITK